MATGKYQGQLIKWNDDRGFGFIKSHQGGKDIFLHISAVQNASRRPWVGDTVCYELIVEPNGKQRAINASIQGATLTPSTQSSPRRQQRPIPPILPQRQPKHQPQTPPRKGQSSDILGSVAIVIGGCIVASFGVFALMTDQSLPFPKTQPSQATAPNHQSELTPVTQASQPTPVTQPSQSAPVPQPRQPTSATQPTPVPQASQANETPIEYPNEEPSACVIKGNISISTGKKLYHVPGMEDYDITEIDLLKGERWFCSEEEATNNGWRKAPR